MFPWVKWKDVWKTATTSLVVSVGATSVIVESRSVSNKMKGLLESAGDEERGWMEFHSRLVEVVPRFQLDLDTSRLEDV